MTDTRPPRRIAVLASGRGSNLRALLDHFEALGDERGGEVVFVGSDREDAGALTVARDRELPAARLPMDGSHAAALEATLREHRVDLVALAGYIRLVPESVVRAFAGRILNVHPALLPSFGGKGMYGARVHRAVLDSGARVSGPTVHFVDTEYDRGPIIAQWPVPVLATDSVETLAARVLRAEHLLFPRAVDAIAGGRVWLSADARVHGVLAVDEAPANAFALLTHEDKFIASSMDRLFAR